MLSVFNQMRISRGIPNSFKQYPYYFVVLYILLSLLFISFYLLNFMRAKVAEILRIIFRSLWHMQKKIVKDI